MTDAGSESTRSTVVVVGAGPSGLGAATALAASHRTVLVERIPVAGGTAGWDNPTVREMTERASAAGVEFRLGQTAIRWHDGRLTVVGPGTSSHLACAHLFFAGGLRPATLANLAISGARPAGIVPATVAEHLLQTRTRLWTNVAVIGDGHWASEIAGRARQLGTRIIGIGASTPWADESHARPTAWSVSGDDRVDALTLVYGSPDHSSAASTNGSAPDADADTVTTSGAAADTPATAGDTAGHERGGATGSDQDRAHQHGDAVVRVECDAIVLAQDPIPNRNVDGAVLGTSAGVTFIQPAAPHQALKRYDSAVRVATRWLATSRKVDAR